MNMGALTVAAYTFLVVFVLVWISGWSWIERAQD